MKQRRYIMLFGDLLDSVSELEDDAAGRLLKAILRYAKDSTVEEPEGIEKLIYRMLMAQFARDEEAYRKKSERNKQYRDSKRALGDNKPEVYEEDLGSQKKHVEVKKSIQYKDQDKDKNQYEDEDEDEDNRRARVSAREDEVNPQFNPPTPQQVAAFARNHGLTVDTAHFVNYYESLGWRTSTGQKVTNWKASLLSWAAREPRFSGGSDPPQSWGKVVSHQLYSQRDYTKPATTDSSPARDAADKLMHKYQEMWGSVLKPEVLK